MDSTLNKYGSPAPSPHDTSPAAAGCSCVPSAAQHSAAQRRWRQQRNAATGAHVSGCEVLFNFRHRTRNQSAKACPVSRTAEGPLGCVPILSVPGVSKPLPGTAAAVPCTRIQRTPRHPPHGHLPIAAATDARMRGHDKRGGWCHSVARTLSRATIPSGATLPHAYCCTAHVKRSMV